jgi:hypothetical protein
VQESDLAESKDRINALNAQEVSLDDVQSGTLFQISDCISFERLCVAFRNEFVFYGEGLLAQRPTPKLDDHPSSFVPRLLIQYIRS